MDPRVSFKFADDSLNRRLIALLTKKRVRHTVDADGRILYSPDDEEFVENDLISSIRKKVFSEWQVLFCPKDWVDVYEQYMSRHAIPFKEELIDGQVSFLLPRKYRPHRWKLNRERSKSAAREYSPI